MRYFNLKRGKVIQKEDYSKVIIFNENELPGKGHLLQVVTIPPKTKQRLHFHDYQTEVFYVLENECLIYINDKKFLAKPGDAFVCSPKDKHNLHNKSDKEFKLVVFKINLQKKDDTHWEEKSA